MIVIAAAIIHLSFPCSMSFRKVVYSKRRVSRMPLFRFEQNGKAGFIDARGKVVIRPGFEPGWFAEEDFVEGLSPAQGATHHWGFIDEKGTWVVKPDYWRVHHFSEGLAAVTHQLVEHHFAMGYVDKKGNEVIRLPATVSTAERFSEGLAAVRVTGYQSIGKLGYIDRSGSVVIPFLFAVGGDFHGGLARVVLDGQCYIESNGGSRQPPPSVPAATSCGGVPTFITTRCREGFIDRTGALRFEFDATQDFSEGLAAVRSQDKWGYIDPAGRLVIEPRFNEATAFSEGLAAVKSNSTWGYIDPTGAVVIPFDFASAGDFSDGVAKVDGGYVDRSGKRVLAGWKDASSFVQGLAHVALGKDNYGYIDKSGKVVFRYQGTNYNEYR
ncbi:MAG: WG repeat-containing protein [Acidobacteria bacterium]|nr:WG repeat-containing protein [Acidobacteriota bacterium]